MAQHDQPHCIGVVVFPGAQAAAVLGLIDLLETANRLHAAETGGARLEVRTVEPPMVPPTRPFSALVLPPSLGPNEPSGFEALTSWLAARHKEGTLLCSVCVGAFVLAQTGLLAGRPATTHMALQERFAARFPDVLLNTNERVIDDGDVMTAGGVMAWVDVGLRLVGRYLGSATVRATAQHFWVDGREQQLPCSFVPALTHGDDAILRTQHWIHAKHSGKVTLADMAAKAGLHERTFLRRFQAATGQTPTAYLQMLRVAKAQALLERSKHSVDEIAWMVGYQDTSAFRRVFVRVIGLSPGEYRRRFAPDSANGAQPPNGPPKAR